MNKTASLGLLLLALPLSLPAQAQVDLNRVEVSGSKLPMITRFDVRSTCPSVDEHLDKALGYLVGIEQASGIVAVNFTIKDSQIATVETTGGPREYRRPLRRAVQQLACNDGGGRNEQRYQFQVSFLPPSPDEPLPRVALLEFRP